MVVLSTHITMDSRASDAGGSEVVPPKAVDSESQLTQLNLESLLDTKLWNLPGWNNDEYVVYQYP